MHQMFKENVEKRHGKIPKPLWKVMEKSRNFDNRNRDLKLFAEPNMQSLGFS